MEISYGNAVREAIFDEMLDNENVVMLGQDIEDNLYGYTEGVRERFGSRILNTPLSEAATTGTAIGSSMCGIRPILDLTVSSFLYVAMDQIVSMASKTRYMYDGQFELPLTIMCSSMYGANNSSQHSDRPHSMFMNVPGLKIICPATAQDAYSLHRSAFKDNNPVLVFTDRSLFYDTANIDKNIEVSIGKANIIKEGNDITIVSISGGIKCVRESLEELESAGISSEIIDVRSLVPLDIETIAASVRKTGKVLIVDTSNRTCSAASHISSLLVEKYFDAVKAPIGIVSYDDVPVPFARKLEVSIMPTKEKVVKEALKIVAWS